MAEKQRILIVDDDENIAELISLYLMKECYETYIVNDGEEALKIFPEFKPNLILLDLMLPGIDGYQVCRELRATSQVPIIMLSAKGEIFDKVLGLELGADDYMIKPFDSKELVARVKAVLRRYQAAPAPAAPEPAQQGEYVEYPDLTVNLTNYAVTYCGHSVEMPPKELELLYFLASSPNQVFTREQLLDHIWGYEYIGDTRTVDVHIKRLREKIKDHANWALTTVWGIGYKFEVRKKKVDRHLSRCLSTFLLDPGSVPADVAAIRSPAIYKHGSGAVRVIPFSVILDPSAAQITIHSKAIPDSVYLHPAAHRVASIFKLEPFAALVNAPVVALCGGKILSAACCHTGTSGAGWISSGIPGASGNIFSISGTSGIAVAVIIAEIICFLRSQKHGIGTYPLSLCRSASHSTYHKAVVAPAGHVTGKIIGIIVNRCGTHHRRIVPVQLHLIIPG